MITRRSILAASMAALVVGCAQPKPPQTSAVPVHYVEVFAPPPPETKSLDLTLHADAGFSVEAQKLIVQATDVWRTLSEGRVNINVVFDFDASWADMANLQLYSILIPVMSDGPIAAKLDETLSRGEYVPVAATTTFPTGARHVFLVVDRILPEEVFRVLEHELGHVAGFPDLPTYGSIMSAVSGSGVDATEPSEYDRALCVLAKFCKK